MTAIVLKYSAFALCAAAALSSFYGWGTLLRPGGRGAAVTAAVGLAFFLSLGGLLNLLRCAFGWTLDLLLLAGLALALRRLVYALRGGAGLRDPAPRAESLLPAALAALLLLPVVLTQAPPAAFNMHDDFEKYFAHPVRMLQTGTLFGSPLSALGSETLGGLAVLHGAILNHFPLPYLNAADAAFGLLLCLLLSFAALPPERRALPAALAAPLAVFFINPQYVNVSALYLGAALMLAAALLFAGGDRPGELPPPAAAGALYAGLAALKPLFLLFAPLHLGFVLAALALSGRPRAGLARLALAAAGFTLLFLLPWLLLHLPNYLGPYAAGPADPGAPGREPFPPFFSAAAGGYGGAPALYALAWLLPAAAGLYALLRCRRGEPGYAAAAGACLACAAAAPLPALFGPALNGYAAGLRYAVPFLLAGIPAALQLLWPGGAPKLRAALLAGAALVLLAFAPLLPARLRQWFSAGSALSFSGLAANPAYIAYNAEALGPETAARVRAAQEAVPPGEPLTAWLYAPFRLDYARNPVCDAEPAGLGSPWAVPPPARYYLVEYRGRAVRPPEYFLKSAEYFSGRERRIALNSLAFMRRLEELRKGSTELYNDGRLAVFRTAAAN